MREYQHGDESAFKLLYARYARRIFGYLTARVKKREEIHDLFQKIFLKLHKSRATYKIGAPFAPWIFTICRTVVVDHFRSDKLFREIERPQTEYAVVPEVEAYLETLSPRERKAVEDRFLNEKSFSEIARDLNTSVPNSRQIISRALRKIKIGSDR